MSDTVEQARRYVALNAAESGTDVLLLAMADEIERSREALDKWEATVKASEHRVAVWQEKVERLRGTLEYILEQAKADYPTVLSVIKANAKAALDDEWQKTYAAARAALEAKP